MNKDFWFITITGLLLIGICIALMAVPASAYYPRLEQGQDVYINDTVDISGVAAGYNSLVWCGEYSDWLSPDNESILYELTLPKRKSEYYTFYLDPMIFENRTGWWYKWAGDFEKNANMRAFRVVPGTVAYQYFTEGSEGNATYNLTIVYLNQTEMNVATVPPPPVEVRHISDYLIARGDTWNMTWNGTAKLWLFGYYNAASMGLYDYPNVNDTFSLRKNQTQLLMPGSYKMVVQKYGNESQNFNARYDPVKDQIEYFNPKIFQVLHVDLKPLGLNQEVRLQKFREIWNYTMDDWVEYNLTVQNPSIEITELEQLEWMENMTYLHLLGYTNVQNGTPLMFILDKDKQTPRSLKYSSYTTTAQGIGLGDMRWFEISIPLIWENTYPGEHSVTANTSVGGEMKYDYYIWESPASSYVPPKTVKYVGGNEFIPTPTPEIITVEVTRDVIKVQTVVHVETVDYDKLAREQANKSVPLVMGYIGWGLVLGIPSIYALSVALRAVYRIVNKKKKEEK